ncbi:hypothetical protein ACH196_34835, partial [Mesorhizobium sp. IMUNJ23232]
QRARPGCATPTSFTRSGAHPRALHEGGQNWTPIRGQLCAPIDSFGSVPRHYIRTTQDRAVPLTGQDHMIAAVDGTIGGTTITHTMESSHSPFLSQPAALSRILLDISVRFVADQRGREAGLDA